jgi:hypothetical protein
MILMIAVLVMERIISLVQNIMDSVKILTIKVLDVLDYNSSSEGEGEFLT